MKPWSAHTRQDATIQDTSNAGVCLISTKLPEQYFIHTWPRTSHFPTTRAPTWRMDDVMKPHRPWEDLWPKVWLAPIGGNPILCLFLELYASYPVSNTIIVPGFSDIFSPGSYCLRSRVRARSSERTADDAFKICRVIGPQIEMAQYCRGSRFGGEGGTAMYKTLDSSSLA